MTPPLLTPEAGFRAVEFRLPLSRQVGRLKDVRVMFRKVDPVDYIIVLNPTYSETRSLAT